MTGDELAPGDLLLASRPGGTPAPLALDQTEAAKLSKRIKPFKKPTEVLRQSAPLVLPLGFLIYLLFNRPPVGVTIFGILFSLVFLWFFGWGIVRSSRGNLIMRRGCTQTTAELVNLHQVEHESEARNYYTNHVSLSFTPSLAKEFSGTVLLDSEVSRKFWEDLHFQGKTVKICYATENPHVVRIEGE